MSNFTPSKIVVGQKYSHTEQPNAIYLGCRTAGKVGAIGTTKFLVVLSCNNPKQIGNTVFRNNKRNHPHNNQNWWNNFRAINVVD